MSYIKMTNEKHEFDPWGNPPYCRKCKLSKCDSIHILPVSDWPKIHLLLHVLWTKAVGTPDYVKSEWQELDNYINSTAIRLPTKE